MRRRAVREAGWAPAAAPWRRRPPRRSARCASSAPTHQETPTSTWTRSPCLGSPAHHPPTPAARPSPPASQYPSSSRRFPGPAHNRVPRRAEQNASQARMAARTLRMNTPRVSWKTESSRCRFSSLLTPFGGCARVRRGGARSGLGGAGATGRLVACGLVARVGGAALAIPGNARSCSGRSDGERGRGSGGKIYVGSGVRGSWDSSLLKFEEGHNHAVLHVPIRPSPSLYGDVA